MADTLTTTTESKVSIFDQGYIDTSKSNNYSDDVNPGSGKQKCYLQINDEALDSLYTKGMSANDVASMRDDAFWEMIVTDFSEAHGEKVSTHNTLSEAFCWFVLGPNPVHVQLTAHMLCTRTNDYRTKFLHLYAAGLRARQLTRAARTLTLVVKDACMNLIVNSISFAETSAIPEYTTFTLSGVACKYRMNNANTEPLYTGYYGQTGALPTSKSEFDSKNKNKENTDSDLRLIKAK